MASWRLSLTKVVYVFSSPVFSEMKSMRYVWAEKTSNNKAVHVCALSFRGKYSVLLNFITPFHNDFYLK